MHTEYRGEEFKVLYPAFSSPDAKNHYLTALKCGCSPGLTEGQTADPGATRPLKQDTTVEIQAAGGTNLEAGEARQ